MKENEAKFKNHPIRSIWCQMQLNSNYIQKREKNFAHVHVHSTRTSTNDINDTNCIPSITI